MNEILNRLADLLADTPYDQWLGILEDLPGFSDIEFAELNQVLGAIEEGILDQNFDGPRGVVCYLFEDGSPVLLEAGRKLEGALDRKYRK